MSRTLLKVSASIFQSLPCFWNTSVTVNSVFASLPLTTALNVMRLQTMAVFSNTSAATSWTSVCLYQIRPVLMMSSSSSFFQVPLMCTNFDLSWNSGASLSTSLSAIHCHLFFDS